MGRSGYQARLHRVVDFNLAGAESLDAPKPIGEHGLCTIFPLIYSSENGEHGRSVRLFEIVGRSCVKTAQRILSYTEQEFVAGLILRWHERFRRISDAHDLIGFYTCHRVITGADL